MERSETIESTNECRISSTGCGTGSTSTGESTSSSSPGFPVGNEGQCAKEEAQEDNHRTHQGTVIIVYNVLRNKEYNILEIK